MESQISIIRHDVHKSKHPRDQTLSAAVIKLWLLNESKYFYGLKDRKLVKNVINCVM